MRSRPGVARTDVRPTDSHARYVYRHVQMLEMHRSLIQICAGDDIMTAALQLHLAKRTHSITKRMLRIISFIIYDDKAADAGCAVAAECRSRGRGCQ